MSMQVVKEIHFNKPLDVQGGLGRMPAPFNRTPVPKEGTENPKYRSSLVLNFAFFIFNSTLLNKASSEIKTAIINSLTPSLGRNVWPVLTETTRGKFKEILFTHFVYFHVILPNASNYTTKFDKKKFYRAKQKQ